jgi:hypothetical protein
MYSVPAEAAMLSKEHVERVAEHIWEIPKSFRQDMRVPARLYADEDLLDAALSDISVLQLVNTATLPGVIKQAIAMPDIHQGYGFPIGGVVATPLSRRCWASGTVERRFLQGSCGRRYHLCPEAEYIIA